jgi:hypothetical protein
MPGATRVLERQGLSDSKKSFKSPTHFPDWEFRL